MRPYAYFNRYSVLLITFLTCFFAEAKILAAPADKIQQSIDAIKRSFYSESQDYHTDGKRTVWVKSYKRWNPDDLKILKKEAPDVLKFLGQAVEHHRLDVLEQLLPNHYRTRGGAKAFSDDINRILNH